MRKAFIGWGMAGLLCACAASAQPNLIDDPGFALADGTTQTSNSDWTLTANQPDGLNFSAQFEDAAFASDPMDAGNTVGVWFKSFEGAQAGGDLLAQALLSQVVPNVPAGDYTLEFSVKREINFLADSWVATLSSSGSGGTDQLDLLASVPNDGSWTTRTLTLTGVSSGDDLTVSVEMIDGENAGLNPQSAFVDLFVLQGSGESIIAIPTLGSWTMAGFALLLALIGWRALHSPR
jgi:hypothetical protein